MKIGGFGHINDYLQISAAGYDFAELDIPEIASLSFADLKTLQQKIKNGIPVPIASRLLPVTDTADLICLVMFLEPSHTIIL